MYIPFLGKCLGTGVEGRRVREHKISNRHTCVVVISEMFITAHHEFHDVMSIHCLNLASSSLRYNASALDGQFSLNIMVSLR